MANGATGAQVSTRQVGVLSRGWPAQAKVVFGKSMPTAGNRWPSGLRRLEAHGEHRYEGFRTARQTPTGISSLRQRLRKHFTVGRRAVRQLGRRGVSFPGQPSPGRRSGGAPIGRSDRDSCA